MHGYPYGPPLVSYRPLHRLPNPPGGVGGEAEAPVGVELLNCLHKPYVSLLDEVLEGEAVSTVLLGYGDHQTQVLLDEPLAGALVALSGASAEIQLLRVGQQPIPGDFDQVARDELRGLGIHSLETGQAVGHLCVTSPFVDSELPRGCSAGP